MSNPMALQMNWLTSTCRKQLSLLVPWAILLLAVSKACFAQEGSFDRAFAAPRGNQDDPSYMIETRNFDKATMFYPSKTELNNLEVRWSEATIDKQAQLCTVSGEIVRRLNGGIRKIYWRQYIAVRVNCAPNETPDWSQGVDDNLVISKETLTDSEGYFSTTFDFSPLNTSRDHPETFQIGISFARQQFSDSNTFTIEIGSKFPVLENSIAMLCMPPVDGSHEVLRLLARTSFYNDKNPTNVDVIRASNALRTLGKDQAIKAMWQFMELNEEDEKDYESESLYGVIQCAFEPADPNERLPNSSFHRQRIRDAVYPLRKAWPRNPFDLSGNIPWLYPALGGSTGPATSPRTDLIWLKQHGIIRDSPLRPADNPLLVVEQLIHEPRFTKLSQSNREYAETGYKLQALEMIEELISPIPTKSWNDYEEADNWDTLLEQSKALGLHWDENKQSYAIKPIR
jgi:hypothetical protein